MNLERICRTCTCECLEMFTLFSECDSVPLECTKKLSDMITACTSVQISINDGLPELICARCINELTISYTFKKRCEKADAVIRQQIKQNIENISNGNEIVSNNERGQEKNDSHTKSDVEFIEGKKRSAPNEIPSANDYVKQTCDNNLTLHNIKSCINNGDDDFKDAIKVTKVETIEEFILEEAKIEFQEYDIDTFTSDVYGENGLKCETESFSETEDKPLSKRKLSVKLCDKSERYNCVKCGASFSTQSNWHRHVKTHDNKTYVCEICNKAFARSDGLAVHIQRHANNGKQHICITCGKKYSSKSSLSVHMLIHSKNNLNSLKEKPHQCHYCQKCFISNSSLVIHIRTHTKEKPFLCQTCGKGFATRGGVDLHQRRHTGERPYKCEFCGKGFAESSNLKVHIRAHTGDKPHLCSLCGKRFTRNFLLQLHIRTHTGEKPYACPECPKAFAQQGDLAAHKRTHTGQRPHVCQNCGQGFIKSSGLKKHIQSKHPKDHVESSTEELILPV